MTRISNVHTREIGAPAGLVGRILDTLGSTEDRLWATDMWPAEPVTFDRPLGVGADGGHGSIRYSVTEYEPGRRIVFGFSPGSGLSGSHGFQVEPLGSDRCRLTHFLEAGTSRWLRPVVPILTAWHDAMVETAFDRAELEATGTLERRTRIPRWLQVVNGTEVALGRALGRIPPGARDTRRLAFTDRRFLATRIVAPCAIGAVAVIHAAWALGWRWPGGTDQALAERVVGAGAELPPTPLIWAVTGLLGAAATVVAVVGAGRRDQVLVAAAWSVAGVFVVRGVVFIPIDLISRLDSTYAQLDLVLYSPLCILLGLGAAIVARGPRPAGPAAVAGRARPRRTRAGHRQTGTVDVSAAVEPPRR